MIGIIKKLTRSLTSNTNLSIVDNETNQLQVVENPVVPAPVNLDILWIEHEIPNLKEAVSPVIYQTLQRIEELKKTIENDSKLSLSVTDQAQIHHMLNVDIKARLLKYLEIPKAQANGIIIRDNKTAKDILNDQLNEIYYSINKILKQNVENKLSEFLTVSNQLTEERERAVQNMKLALIPYWESDENEYDFREYYKQVNTNMKLGVSKFVQSFEYLSNIEHLKTQMNRIYGIGLHVNQKYKMIEQTYSVSVEDLDCINQFINKTKTANLNDNYAKQDLLINKVKVDIISNKLNDFLLMISDNKIIEIYTEDLSILEEVLKQFNTTYMGNNEMLGLLDTQTFVKFQEYLHTNLILINQKIAMYQLILTNFKESCEQLLNS